MKLKPFIRALLPRSIRNHRVWFGPLRGARIATSWHDYPAAILGRTERQLLMWFAANAQAGETWLDVGAHYGYTAIALSRQVTAAGRVFAFEPMISTAGYLEQTRMLNDLEQLTVVPFALGATRDVETRRLLTSRGMADQTVATGALSDGLLVARLDWLWPKICGDNPRIDGIKIDVQGMEGEALEGMRELLARFRPKLVIEFHRGVDRNAIINLLRAVGYAVDAVAIEPVSGETKPQLLDDHSYAFASVN